MRPPTSWLAGKDGTTMKAGKRDNADAFLEAARRAVRKAGWDPHLDLEILNPGGSPTEGAPRYGYRPDKVRLVRPPELAGQLAQTLQTLGQRGPQRVTQALRDVLASWVYLQVGSFKVCPYSAYDYAELLGACADGLRSAGASAREVLDCTVPLTSFFVASVISGVYAVEGPHPSAFRRGWVLDHLNSSLAQEHTLPTYSSVYINVQLRLWADDPVLAAGVRACYPTPLDSLDFETDRGVAILVDSFDYVGCSEDGLVWSDDYVRRLLVDELKYEWRKWPIKAFQFAEMLAPYIISEQSGRQSVPRNSPRQTRPGERPSEEAEQRRVAVSLGDLQNTQALLSQDGPYTGQLAGAPIDPFTARLINDSAFRRQVMQIGIGRGKNPLKHHMGFDALDAVYRSRAAKVRVKSESVVKQAMAFAIAHMAREPIVDSLPSLSRVDWSATRVGPDGRLKLYAKALPITDETSVTAEVSGFPDLLFVVDSSGSMKWNPINGIGPYDSLLRAVYSVFAFLEAENKAPYMKFAAVNFSGSTLRTPWHPYHELDEVKRLLFKRQAGGTILDCSLLAGLAQESTDRFLCLMITDGQVRNANEVVRTVQKIARLGHGVALIHIGKPVPMTIGMKQAGVVVHTIDDHTQLGGLCLDYAHKTWKAQEVSDGS
jgi:hypothetical protein